MSASVRNARFVSPDRISELVLASESDKGGAQSEVISEDEEGFEDELTGVRPAREPPNIQWKSIQQFVLIKFL
jgi:hypothetical protein